MRTLSLLLVVFTATGTLCAEKGNLLRENHLLESELELAKKSKIYVLFDLHNKKVLIKVKGIELTEFPLDSTTLWGNPPAYSPMALTKKGSFVRPRRKQIEPGERKDHQNFAPEALEVTDMPSRYVLYFEHGVSVCVKPAPEGVFSGLLDACYSVTGTLSRSFHSAWSLLSKKPFSEVDITLKKNDAQALYWTMFEETSCIIGPP